LTPGCGKPTFNGKPGEYCSMSCKNSPQAPVCLKPGCGKPTFNGKPGEHCSMSCKNSPQAALCFNPPARPGSNNPGLLLLQLGDGKFDSVKKQYEDKWDKSRGPPTPIRAIYEVQASAAQEKAFRDECTRIGHVNVSGMGTNPGNEQRMFHGTALKCGFQGSLCSNPACSTCSIIQNGFDMTKVGAWSGKKGVYGDGIYFTSMSSTAKGYGIDTSAGYTFQNNNWNHPAAGNSVLVVTVACGRVETVTQQTGAPLDFNQYDSRKIDKATGVDELVIWHNEKALVRYVVVF